MSVYSATVLADSPSLYLRLGEPSGTNANDETANNRDGTYVGTPTLGAAGGLVGDADTAVDLNGTSQYVSTAYNPFTNSTTRTFEGWAWRDVIAGHAPLFAGTTAARPLLRIGGNEEWCYFFSASSVQVWWLAWPGITQWAHWVLVFNESTNVAELFVNGVSKGTGQQAQTDAYNASPGNIQFGADTAGGVYFNGKIDEVAVYEYGLSAARIKHHWDVGKGKIGVDHRRAPGAAVSMAASGAVYL